MTGFELTDIVTQPSLAAINLAYVALLVGAFCSSMRGVRLLLVLASALFVVYGTLAAILSMVVWNVVIGGLHLYRLATDAWGSATVSLSAQQDTLRRQLLPGMGPADFLRGWQHGEDVFCVDRRLVSAGADPDTLYLLVRGTVNIQRDGVVLETLSPGAVIGQIEPTRFSSPSADWWADGAVWLRSWPVAELAEPELRRWAMRSLTPTGPALAGAPA